jgi:hypothetical protein
VQPINDLSGDEAHSDESCGLSAMTGPRLALAPDFQRLPYAFMVEGLNRMFFGPFESSEAASGWMERTGQVGVVHRLIAPYEPKVEEELNSATVHRLEDLQVRRKTVVADDGP